MGQFEIGFGESCWCCSRLTDSGELIDGLFECAGWLGWVELEVVLLLAI
jgi:hypothetical protein